MTYAHKQYILIKGIPIGAMLLYLLLSFFAYMATADAGWSRLIWVVPFGFGLLALILGEPIRRKKRLTHKWLAAYTRSLGALYATMAFALALQ